VHDEEITLFFSLLIFFCRTLQAVNVQTSTVVCYGVGVLRCVVRVIYVLVVCAGCVLVCWCVGVLVCWCVGVLVCWCVGGDASKSIAAIHQHHSTHAS
jgi:hypothetical protein